MRISYCSILVVLWVASLAGGPSDLRAEPLGPEAIFADAADYTVRVQTRIEQALATDDVGVSEGAGFVVDIERGWIVTNRHVVGASPSEVRVALRDGTYQPASKVYVDPLSDIAVIESDLNAHAAASLGCAAKFGTGHPVGAYGHPWGLEYTGTQGVVSGVTSEVGPRLLQTDAPINSGNSGGPLISLRDGQVLGISTSSYQAEGAQNMNFAVPISSVCRILDLLIRDMDPSPPQLPVAFYQFNDRDELVVARSYREDTTLKLREGDVITAVGSDEHPVTSAYDLAESLRGQLDDVRITVRREGKPVRLRGTLAPQRLPAALAFAGMVIGESGFVDSEHLPTGHGLLVHSVLPGSQAQAAELQPEWDFIARVEGERIQSLGHLFDVLKALTPGSRIAIDFVRLYEPPFLFEYVRREFTAAQPQWLDSERP